MYEILNFVSKPLIRMQLQAAVQGIFFQLSEIIGMLSDDQFIHESEVLSKATIGQHSRHVIEMFICLEEGYDQGVVNYESRRRDKIIETDRNVALELLTTILNNLEKPDKEMVLQAAFSEDSDEPISFNTNYQREIAYNLEHAIHHMALIKVGVREFPNITLPEGFGVASSTLKYKKECAR